MITKIRSYSNKLGVDGAIAYTVLSRCIQAGGGVITIIFIAKYLSKVEQGYYYTFGSILAIQIFFELGLSNIITQYVAHEMALLQWEGKSQLKGSEEALSRLSSLLHFCMKWFAVMALVLVFVLVGVGYVFFNKYGTAQSGVDWQVPWVILAVFTASSLIMSPVLAFFEGLSKVKEVAMIRLFQQTAQLLLLILFLNLGFKLFASPIAAMLAFFIAPCWIYFSYKKTLLINIWKQLKQWRVNYKEEIFPFQWRIALSWMSGYFIFQLFNPVLFATDGPVVAGQMGMTLAALNGVISISMSWINTKVPLFSNLIARKEYDTLDVIFNKTVKQSSLICATALCGLIAVVFVLQYFNIQIGTRFLPIIPLTLLCAATFVNQLISSMATYLRCHKQEPYLIQSIVLGVLTAASTFILGHFFGINGVVGGYSFLVIVVGLAWSFFIFKIKKKLWHS